MSRTLYRKTPKGKISTLIPVLCLAIPVMAVVDFNGNGMDDVWENYYSATGLSLHGDADWDGVDNYEESVAGTDPLNGSSYLYPMLEIVESNSVYSWAAQPGKTYQPQLRLDLVSSNWIDIAMDPMSFVVDTNLSLSIPMLWGSAFFRVEVSEMDSDVDLLTDWSELKMVDFNPNDPASSGQDDFLTVSNSLHAASNVVTVSTQSPKAFESTGAPARFRIERNGRLDPLTVHFSLGGFTNGTRGSASTSDYAAKGQGGNLLSGSVDLPFGSRGADVLIAPTADALDEVPEVVNLKLLPDSGYAIGPSNNAEVLVCDAEDLPGNEKLFFAYLSAVPGIPTTASGYSVLYLSGDNARARVTVFPVTSGYLTSDEDDKKLLASGGLVELFTLKNPDGSNVVNTNGEPVDAVGPLDDYQIAVDRMNLSGGAFTANQQFLDELIGGGIHLDVASDSYPLGELTGYFSRQTGSSELVIPPAPPALETLSPDELVRDVSRFLMQATFGPTQQEIADLVHSVTNDFGGDRITAYEAWIDNQFALQQTSLYDYTLAADNQEWEQRGYGAYTNTLFPPYPPNNYPLGEPNHNNRRRGHWLLMARAQDQLRQRMAFALSQILVVSEDAAKVRNNHYGAAKYYDMLGSHADGLYRNLLEDVSYSPIMGVYLSHLKNQKEQVDGMGNVTISPDENYAREIMQLFSIGLIYQHLDGSLKLGPDGLPIPTYNNTGITEMAKVFTGLSFSKWANGVDATTNSYVVNDNTYFERGDGNKYYGERFTHPMKMFDSYHDAGPKTILGDVLIDNGGNGDADISDALDALANHPNTAPFICRQLIQRLVTSNPSAGYIYRVSQVFADNGSGVRGDFKAVVKAILLDYEARSLSLVGNEGYGKKKEPIIAYVGLLRAFDAQSQLPLSDLLAYGYPASQLSIFPAGTTRYRYPDTDSVLGQTPMAAPSVFNWYRPDYAPAGAISTAGLDAPEFQIATETSVIQAVNYHNNICRNATGQSVNALVGETNGVLDNVQLDRAALQQIYDGALAGGATQEGAVTLLVDHCDGLLMAGHFKARYAGAPEPNPRSIVIGFGVVADNASRVADILYLMSTCPDFLIQK